MNFKKLFGTSAAVIAASAMSMGVANAAVINFNYGSDTVATLTTSGNTTFSFSFNYAPAAPGVAFINDILLGYNGSLGSVGFQNLSGQAASFCVVGPGCAGEGTGADVKISWPTANNPSRLTEGESSTFRLYTTDAGLWDFSRLHVNAFLNGESIKLTGCDSTNRACATSVPEPGTLGLLGLGLLGLGLGRLRRKT